MHYYQFNIKTYIASTAHLTNGEDLAYRRLIDHYYDTELPIPTALPLLCRRLRLDLTDVESVLNEFFIECEDGWRHSYIDNEIKAYKTFIARQKANGSKGGRASNANANPPLTQTEPTAKPTSNNKPITNNHKPIVEKTTTRGARLSTHFEPDFDFAKQNGIANPAEEYEKFKDYWFSQAGAKGVKLDWQATWRNWCRSAKTFTKAQAFTQPSPAITTPSREATDPIMTKAIQESMRTLQPVTEIYKSMKNKALGVAA